MINLFPEMKPINKQQGVATLITSVLLMVTITMIVLFAGTYSLLQQKITANAYRNNQALQAAEAGLNFGVLYLQQNSSAILANPTEGYINAYANSSIQNVALANNSQYTIVYTNPVANNYNLIKITATGTSNDGLAIRTVSQLVQFGSLLATTPGAALVSKGSVSLGGSSTITNTQTNATIQSASTVSFSGSSSTVISSGVGSNSSSIGGDVQQNNASLANTSESDFFATYFGANATTIKNSVANYYSNNTSTNYSSSLNGKTGTSIWIDQTAGQATISGTTTIGSSTQPVLMVVNGDLQISGSVTIYGFIYVLGSTTTDVLGSVDIIGGLVSTGNLSLTGSTNITFNSSVLNATQQSTGYYAKLSGSWKDF